MPIFKTLARALHNVISTRPPKTNRLLLLFLLCVISITSFVLFQVSTIGLEKDLRVQHLQATHFRAETLSKQIHNFIDTHIKLAVNQGHLPIVQQSIMQPETGRLVLADWFNEPGIFGHLYPQLLTDFNGMEIASRQVPEIAEFSVGKFQHVLDGGIPQAIDLVNAGSDTYIELAVPVTYANTPEGLLITWLPIGDLGESLNLSRLSGLAIRLSNNVGLEQVWGKGNANYWQPISTKAGLSISYQADLSAFEKAIADARERLAISTGIVALIAALLAALLGRFFFVIPLERLQQFAAQLSSGAEPELAQTKRLTVEIQALSDQIIDMGKRIRQREQSLLNANEVLRQKQDELQRNQQSLVMAEKMAGLGQVTAGVAHEINNPTGFIMNNLCTLHEYHYFLNKLTQELMAWRDMPENTDPEKREELASRIEETLKLENLHFVLTDMKTLVEESIEGAERIKDITQGLKGYAYSGEKEGPVDINDCILSTLKMVRNEIKYHCEVETDLQDLPPLTCIGGHINQVLMNLIVNAGHAMEGKQGLLKITTHYDGHDIHIMIEDNGCGIPEDKIDRIFEPFYTTKPVGQGTGLGMSISYDIIQKYRGTIKVSSKLNEGTRFEITFPCRDDQ